MRRSLLVAVASLLLVGTVVPAAARAGSGGAHRTTSHSNDVVLEWNAVMQSTVASQNPFAQGRFAAITQLAVFEAINAITGHFDPYLGTVTAPKNADPEAAAVQAAYRVLINYFPAAAATLDAARANSLAAIPDSKAKDDGLAVGEAAALAMIAERTDDGSAPPAFFTPPSMDPGVWQTTLSCPPAGGILVHWQNVRPFGIESSDQFRSARPPSLTSARYRIDYNEVKRVGRVDSPYRPQDRSDVAVYYNVILAVGVWNPVARQIIEDRRASISDAARALALMNMAINDGLVSVMETKYHHVFWRPETAIRRGDEDGNRRTAGDPTWVPFITTPCFPSYGSAHASASYGAARILQLLFGNGGHSITLSSPNVPGVTLSYRNLRQITDDIDDARVYGGIHFRFDQEAGARQGKRIGSYVISHNLRPVHASWKWASR